MRRKTKWQKENRANFAKMHGFSTTSNYAVGGKRKEVLIRDEYKCVECDMTDAQHKKRYGKPITIDHKDRNRRNNSLDNLQTLCLKCHGAKDISPCLTRKKFLPFLDESIRMREEGKTYQQIADYFRVSTATVWKYLKGELSWKMN